MSLTLPVRKLTNTATLPAYAHSGDAGMDIYASTAVTIPAHGRATVPTGIALAVPVGYVALVWDKSGLATVAGLTTIAGVIDASYRGEVVIAVHNTSNEDYQVVSGKKIAQILIQTIEQVAIVETETLDDTSRGTNGFGSTGL